MSCLREECGVFGICATTPGPVALSVYHGLFALQHRGQESCGIVVNDDGVFSSHKDLGLVNDVFTPQVLAQLGEGAMAVGHVRYGTTGGNNRANCQPVEVNHVKGRLALAHNGNLTNAAALRRELELSGAIFHTTSDTEIITYIIIQERLKCGSIEEAVCRAMDRLEGAYSLVILSPSKLIAVRDPHGFRPLCVGRSDGFYAVASETCALDAVGARFLREVEPGEIVVFSGGEEARSLKDHVGTCPHSLCVFEYIYFARPDSVISGVSVHRARRIAGRCLAEAYPVPADVVIGVPDSGLDAALGYAEASGIPYGLGFVKNKYIGRTFIAPDQQMRRDRVRIKLNPIPDTVRGKRVVMIDDSMVRGTTMERIVALLRDAGALEVHVRLAAPPFIAPCYYGTDIDSRKHLIASDHTVEQICAVIGADSLGYLPTADLCRLTGGCDGFCSACFTEQYPTPIPKDEGKSRFETKISEKK